jgi:hypothetical protein
METLSMSCRPPLCGGFVRPDEFGPWTETEARSLARASPPLPPLMPDEIRDVVGLLARGYPICYGVHDSAPAPVSDG